MKISINCAVCMAIDVYKYNTSRKVCKCECSYSSCPLFISDKSLIKKAISKGNFQF